MKDNVMQRTNRTHAESSVNVIDSEYRPYLTVEHGHILMTGKTIEDYVGDDLNGRGEIRSLLALGKNGTGHFSNLVRFDGVIGGRRGTFVLQGKGWLKGVNLRTGAWSSAGAEWFVVPGSGTGTLAALCGEGGMIDDGDDATVTLNYWFEWGRPIEPGRRVALLRHER